MFCVRRTRFLRTLILLGVVIFVAFIYVNVVFDATPKNIRFTNIDEHVLQGLVENSFPVRLKAADSVSEHSLDSLPKERIGKDHEVQTKVMKDLVELIHQKTDEDSNYSNEKIENKALSKEIAKHSTDVRQTDLFQNLNPVKDKETISKGELSSTFEELTTRPSIQHQTRISSAIIDNGEMRRGFSGDDSYCDLSFKYGKMCPKSYRELGGVCEMSSFRLDCPDIRSKADYPHRQCQLITTRMLRIFDIICKKHNITYWLTGGTLLGAARHKGNIPWDTENDIDIPLQDYIKFFQTASKDLPDDIFFQNSISDPAIIKPYKSAVAASATYQISFNPRLRDKNSCYKYCIRHGCPWHDGMMIDMFIKEEVEGVFPLQQMEFEGFLFPVANNWRSQLERSYGKNFIKVPGKEQDRVPVEFPDTQHSCEELQDLKVQRL